MAELDFNLVENALDFFCEGIEYLDENEPRKLKYAVLHIASAVELILKARLEEEGWIHIFKDPYKADIKKYKSGNFRSVDFQDVLERLEVVCKVDLNVHRPILDKLRLMRNRIQHFVFSGETIEITSVVVKAWSFLMDFIHNEIPDRLEEEQVKVDEIIGRMVKHQKYLEHRLDEIKVQLSDYKENDTLIVGCPLCYEETLIIPGGEDPFCLLCRYKNDPFQVADDWATEFIGYPHTDPKERMIEPVIKECPECTMEAMIEFENGDVRPPDPAWICFYCGASGPPLSRCHKCGDEYVWEEDEYLCPDCRHGVLKNE